MLETPGRRGTLTTARTAGDPLDTRRIQNCRVFTQRGMTILGLFGFGLDLFPHWEGHVGALLPLLVVLLYFAKNCLEDKSCQAVVVDGQNVLEDVQDSISETECSERLGAPTRKRNKEIGTPGGSEKIKMGEKIDLQGQKLSDINNKKKKKPVVYILCRGLKLCKLKVTMKL